MKRIVNAFSLVFAEAAAHRVFVPTIHLMMLIAAASWAEAPVGTWKMSTARSRFMGEIPPTSFTARVEPHTKGEVFTLDCSAADGRARTSSSILYFDGEERAFQDAGCSGTQSSRRVDSQTVEIRRNCAGGGWTRLVRRWVVQAKELTLDITGQRSDGRRFERHIVLEKESK